jgi:hypothetical protein
VVFEAGWKIDKVLVSFFLFVRIFCLLNSHRNLVASGTAAAVCGGIGSDIRK